MSKNDLQMLHNSSISTLDLTESDVEDKDGDITIEVDAVDSDSTTTTSIVTTRSDVSGSQIGGRMAGTNISGSQEPICQKLVALS